MMREDFAVPPIPQDLEFWLHGVPHPLQSVIRIRLQNPYTRPDHVLLVADELEKLAPTQRPDLASNLRGCANALRDFAPRFDSPRVEQEVYNALNA